LQIRGVRPAGPGDDQARFLADLRALRDSAAIGHDELAARAHYPTDILQEAENGPLLPGLPILTAYVRACEGDVLGWEERWRQLNAEVPEDPSLPVRPAGASEAAEAGARAGVSIAPPDAYDPALIRAALRGGHSPADHTARQIGDPGPLSPAAGLAGTEAFADGPGLGMAAETGLAAGAPWDATGWDAGADSTIVNGSQATGTDGHGPLGTAYADAPDTQGTGPEPAGSAAPAQDGDFTWLPESTPEAAGSALAPAAPDSDFDWLKRSSARRDELPAESNVMWSEAETASSLADPAAEPRPWQQDSIMKPPQREDFWGTPTQDPADLQPPAITQASWAAAAEAAPPAAATPPPPAVAEPAAAQPESSPASQAQPQPQSPAHSPGPAHAQAQASVPQPRRGDRLFSVKLIVVIIIAALIGSALVLLLK